MEFIAQFQTFLKKEKRFLGVTSFEVILGVTSFEVILVVSSLGSPNTLIPFIKVWSFGGPPYFISLFVPVVTNPINGRWDARPSHRMPIKNWSPKSECQDPKEEIEFQYCIESG